MYALCTLYSRTTIAQCWVAIICILLVTTNQKCNVLAGTLGFFYHFKNVPEKVIQVLHHIGLSDSAQSIHQTINSMSQCTQKHIYDMGRSLLCSVAYDNFDIHIHTDTPTLTKESTFLHTTSAMLIPLSHGVTVDDL